VIPIGTTRPACVVGSRPEKRTGPCRCGLDGGPCHTSPIVIGVLSLVLNCLLHNDTETPGVRTYKIQLIRIDGVIIHGRDLSQRKYGVSRRSQ
jgi:hypothetical protein